MRMELLIYPKNYKLRIDNQITGTLCSVTTTTLSSPLIAKLVRPEVLIALKEYSNININNIEKVRIHLLNKVFLQERRL